MKRPCENVDFKLKFYPLRLWKSCATRTGIMNKSMPMLVLMMSLIRIKMMRIIWTYMATKKLTLQLATFPVHNTEALKLRCNLRLKMG